MMNTLYLKYPRTYHLPFSKSITSDDKMLKSLDIFKNKEVVVTIKMDGENTTLTKDKTYARSIDSSNHLSRNWIKNFWAGFNNEIPENWRICGENLFAKHSIHYTNLKSYFYGFSIWNEYDCLDWDSTLEWFNLLCIIPVKTIYEGIFDEDAIYNLQFTLNLERDEGFVVRNKTTFHYNDFKDNVAKFVREKHVRSSTHWMYDNIVKNELNS